MSWKPEVITDDTGKWYGNALRFATQREAELSAMDLSMRWTSVRDWRATESDDPVNYSISEEGKLTPVTPAGDA